MSLHVKSESEPQASPKDEIDQLFCCRLSRSCSGSSRKGREPLWPFPHFLYYFYLEVSSFNRALNALAC